MTIKIINNNYYLQIYMHLYKLIKIIFKYFRKTLKSFFSSIIYYKLIINNI